MYTHLHCLALRTVRHSDRASILTAWSAECGRVSLLMPAGNGPESRRRRALTAPMCVFECVGDMRPGRDIMPVRDVKALEVTPGIWSSPVKSAVALFLAEVTSVILPAAMPDARLWQCVRSLVVALEGLGGVALANFHLYYLAVLAAHVGIAPDASGWRRGAVLDMREGAFTLAPPLHHDYLPPAQARLARVLLTADVSRLGMIKLSRADRNVALDAMLKYFTLHYTSMSHLRTLPVLRML